MVSTPGPTRRRDAVRNRAALVEAAAAAFRDEGLGVSVNAIARDAGVNVATLYRHFPTKEHLIAAAMEVVLEPLVQARDRSLASMRPGEVLATFFAEVVRVQAEHRGLAESVGRRHDPSVRDRLREPAMEVVEPLVEIAHRDGELREDFGAVDLLVALHMIGVLGTLPDDQRQDTGRYLDMVLRGLRPG